jgi:transposase
MAGEFFEQWFKKSLLNTVKKGCTIIMDNASFHRKKKLEEVATEGQIRLLFLPPQCTPIINKILINLTDYTVLLAVFNNSFIYF